MLRPSFQLLNIYVRPEWKRVLLLFGLLVCGIGLHLLQPQILRDFIDMTRGEITSTRLGNVQGITGVALLFLLIGLLHHLLTVATNYVIQDVRWRTTNALRADLVRHCLQLDLTFHNDRTPGEMIARVDGDVNSLSDFFAQFITDIVGRSLLILGIVWVLWREDWRLGVWFAILVFIAGHLLVTVFRLAVSRFKASMAIRSELFGFLEERLAGTEDIRANGAVAYTMRRFYEIIVPQYEIEYRSSLVTRLTYSIIPGSFAVGIALGLGLGIYLYQLELISLGTVYLIVSYSSMVQWPLHALAQRLQDLQKAVAAVSRIQELYYTQSRIRFEHADQTLISSSQPVAVEFNHVKFHYNQDNPVLNEFSFQLEPGSVLGILGRTGSGKTTLARLLCRLYEPQAGEILLDQRLISSIPLEQLRHEVGMVTQEVQLFNASIRHNLTLFNQAIPDEQILQALDTLGLRNWIESLPRGLDTQLDGGNSLSAGEAQLLAFTRIFLQEPRLVILDEASARLDPMTEQLIERAINVLLENRTAIIIAHRLSTIQRADEILILEEGRIREYGPRLELANTIGSRFHQLMQIGHNAEEILA